MSDSDSSEEQPSPVDLSSLTELQFMPNWVTEGGDSAKTYKDYDDKGGGRKGRGGPRGKGGGGKGGRDFPGQRDKRQGGRGDNKRGPRGRGDDRGGKPGFRGKGGKGGPRGQQRGGRGGPAQPPPPKGIAAALEPGETAIKQLAEQIKKTMRAYPVFDIAKLVIAGRDRYAVEFKREAGDAESLFECTADGSAWLGRSEAVAHLASTPAFANYYQEEVVQGDPPKGNYTAIAVCGMSNTLLGPPNHHSYQTNIARLHRQRFASMPIERFKSRIRVERDEEIVERWKTEQSVRRHYTYRPDGDAPAAERQPTGRSATDEQPVDPTAPEATSEPPAADTAAEESAGEPQAPGSAELDGEPAAGDAESSPAEGAGDESSDDATPAVEAEAETQDEGEGEGETDSDSDSDSESDGAPAADSDAAAAVDAPEVLKFESREAAERHFVERHAEQFVRPAETVRVSGAIAGRNLSPGLLTLLRNVTDNARKHPASLVQSLCGLLSAEGLKFFKRGRQIYACVTRPKPLADDSSLSQPIRSILQFLRDNKRSDVDKLLAALAPSPAAPPAASAPAGQPEPESKPAAEQPEPARSEAEAEAEAGPKAKPEGESEATAKAPPAQGESPPSAPPSALTAAQIKILQDLRWLLHSGAVIAFDTGHLELAVSKSTPPSPGKAAAQTKAPAKNKSAAVPPPAATEPATPKPASPEPAGPQPAAVTDTPAITPPAGAAQSEPAEKPAPSPPAPPSPPETPPPASGPDA